MFKHPLSSNNVSILFMAGPGAVNYIIDHAEIKFVFVQDKKAKEVSRQLQEMSDDFLLIQNSNYDYSSKF